MPQLGDIKDGRELGYKCHYKWIWHACVDCGRCRWVRLRHGSAEHLRCNSCAGKYKPSARGSRASRWKGGHRSSTNGYSEILLQPSDFFYPMAQQNGYVLEHRLVMAKKLGRCLQPWELVHHKGVRYTGIPNKQDNLEDNLEMTTRGSHAIEHSRGYKAGYQKGLVDGRLKQIEELKQEIRLLRIDNKLLRERIDGNLSRD